MNQQPKSVKLKLVQESSRPVNYSDYTVAEYIARVMGCECWSDYRICREIDKFYLNHVKLSKDKETIHSWNEWIRSPNFSSWWYRNNSVLNWDISDYDLIK